jgi:excisionase family DNA binding protein
MRDEENLKTHDVMANEEYYSIEEVAKMLKVAYLTVYRWIQSKKLRAIKAGKQYRISKSDLDKFVNGNK